MPKNQGGRAFARPISAVDGINVPREQEGMSMRQYYKTAAMNGLVRASLEFQRPITDEAVAKWAGSLADQMIAEDMEAEK